MKIEMLKINKVKDLVTARLEKTFTSEDEMYKFYDENREGWDYIKMTMRELPKYETPDRIN